MLILSQDRRMLESIESSAGVYVDGNEIRIDFLTCCTGFDGYVLGVYEDEQRATEVLKQIFNRYDRGQRVFDMPEE